MTAPNMVNITSMVGKSKNQNVVTGTAQVLLENAASSNKVYKVNTLIVSNIDGTNAADINLLYNDGTTNNYFARSITVPAKSNLVVISKDTSIYLEEGQSLTCAAFVNGDLVCVISWEEIE